MGKIKKIIFIIFMIVLLFSLYEIYSNGGWVASYQFIFWSVIGGISLAGIIVTANSIIQR